MSERAIREAVKITGVDAEAWVPVLLRIEKREDAGGYGPGRPPLNLIDPTFKTFHDPEYPDPEHPVDQVIAAIRYIQSRYGEPSKVTL